MFSSPLFFLLLSTLASQASGNLCVCSLRGYILGGETDGWRFRKGKERKWEPNTGYTHTTQHSTLFSSRRPMPFLFFCTLWTIFSLGVCLKPREGGVGGWDTHTAGVWLFWRGGVTSETRGRRRRGRTGEWKVPISLARPWQSVELISLATSTHTHINGSWRGGVERFFGCLFWLCLFRVRGKGEMGGYTKVYAIVLEMGEKGTRKMGGMNTYKLNLTSTS